MGGALRAGRLTGLVAVWLVASVGVGGFLALLAYEVHPAAPIALVVTLGLLAVASVRPEVGVAAAVVLPTLGTQGYVPNAQLLVTGLAVYLVATVFLTGRSDRLPRLGIVVGVFMLAMLVGFGVAADVVARQQLRMVLTGLALFFVTAAAVRDRGQARTVLAGLAVATLIVGLAAAYEKVTGNIDSPGFVTSSGELVARVTAGFGSPNQLAGFLVASLPLALAGLAIHRRAWALYAPAAALAAFGVYVSFSRGALIGMALVPFVFLRGRQLLAAVPLLAALVLALTPSLLEERFETLTSGGGEIATRVDIWDTSVAIWQAEPVTGAGLGSFPEAYAQARVPGKQFLPHTQFEPPPHAHNVFLQILAEVGIVGLAAFLALLAGALPLAARLRRHGEAWIRWTGAGVLASLVAFLAHNIFDVTLFQPETSVIFWVTLGLLSALAAVGTDRASSRAH